MQRSKSSLAAALMALSIGACAGAEDDRPIEGPSDGDGGGSEPLVAACAEALGARGPHTCMISREHELFCWGRNNRGQLGIGSTEPNPRPQRVTLPGGATPEVVRTGIAHSCALAAGQVYCWGYNSDGLIADGSRVDATVPTLIPGIDDARALYSGGFHVCVIHADDSLSCWGDNVAGQIGNGSQGDDQDSPIVVASEVAEVAAGEEHTCIRSTLDDSVSCWGRNLEGQLGDGSRVSRAQAASVTTGTEVLSGVVAIEAGAFHTCARTSIQTLCWGKNDLGQADGLPGADLLAPTAVAGLGAIEAVSAGEYHSCAIDGAGDVSCWGANFAGQLGQGDSVERTGVRPVANLSGMDALVAGDLHSCALAGGRVRCWGGNDNGQLGDGTYEQADSPVELAARCP